LSISIFLKHLKFLGDSGGPIQLAHMNYVYYVAGVVSFGDAKCGSGDPGVYTRVSKFIDWIESIVWMLE
jgi:secreted trypsin-like serine protease